MKKRKGKNKNQSHKSETLSHNNEMLYHNIKKLNHIIEIRSHHKKDTKSKKERRTIPISVQVICFFHFLHVLISDQVYHKRQIMLKEACR